MLKAIHDRELIHLDVDGVRLQGTYHVAGHNGSSVADDRSSASGVGVLFVNSLSLPRAASGDSAVYWADAIARQGYPAFRFDLPGLGDSQGAASTDLLDRINAGTFATTTASIATQLVARFALSGLIFIGHCAGSVTAVYAGTASAHCQGLILLDPYFHLPQAKRPAVREQLSGWARRSVAGRLASNLYDQAKNLLLTLRGTSLPANANAQLLACWKQVANTGLPLLLLKAPGIKAQGSKPRVGEFDYIDHVVRLAGRKHRVAVEFVEDADHSFANGTGRKAVEQHIANWLGAYFPVPRSNPATAAAGFASHEEVQGTNSTGHMHADRCCTVEGR